MKSIKNFQINTFLDDDFGESSSVIINKIDITKTDLLISLMKVVVLKSSILKVVFIILCKTLQFEKVDQFNNSSMFSSIINSILYKIQFLNFDQKILVVFINQNS